MHTNHLFVVEDDIFCTQAMCQVSLCLGGGGPNHMGPQVGSELYNKLVNTAQGG